MPDPRMKTAIEHQQSGQLPEAEEIYRAILQDDAAHPDAHAGLAEIAFKTGHFEDAARLLHQALQIQPEKPEIWKQLIEALVKAGFEDDAVKVLDEAKQLGLISVNASQ